ncbi:MAG: DUF4197 family protein [Nitrospirota bacterium]
MKNTFSIILLFSVLSITIAHAGLFDDILKSVDVGTQDKALDSSTIVSGLKEALSIGTEKAVENVSQINGYFGNEFIKILMPGEIQKVADVLSKVGYQKQVDDFILSMNRAAEKAAPKALSFFVDSIKEMTRPLKFLGQLTSRGNRFSKVKCTTQFIVGASDETDSEIIEYMFGLYNRLNFKRVYFSAYQKGLGSPDIPGEKNLLPSPQASFMREHRLYQVDFLIRRYGFTEKDIITDNRGNLILDKDPKQVWADDHPEYYPVRINTSEKEALLKVPGLGPGTVNRILRMRRERRITRLEDLGIKGKRLEKTKNYVILE